MGEEGEVEEFERLGRRIGNGMVSDGWRSYVRSTVGNDHVGLRFRLRTGTAGLSQRFGWLQTTVLCDW